MEQVEFAHSRHDLTEPVKAWLLAQLHLATDNFHVRNYHHSNPIQLRLYVSDGHGDWLDKDLGDLAPGDDRWLTITPLTFPMATGYPTGESVLVMTQEKPDPKQLDLVFIDNVYSLPLNYAGYAEERGFSRSSGGKLVYLNMVAPKTPYALAFGEMFTGGPTYGRWELWFQEPVLPKPLP
jgi:hypothetical protein